MTLRASFPAGSLATYEDLLMISMQLQQLEEDIQT